MTSTEHEPDPPGSERRQQTRFPVAIDVSGYSDSTFYTGLTQDLSLGGVFVATHLLPNVGEQLKLTIRLHPFMKSFEIEGIVRWIRTDNPFNDGAPPGFGLEFVGLTPEKEQLVQKFLDEVRSSLLYDDDDLDDDDEDDD